jgi:RNA polymerase sigma-70 factor (ECF subfamily)
MSGGSPCPVRQRAVRAVSARGVENDHGNDRPDAELLRMHLGGDPAAFGALFRRHQQVLWAIAIRMLGDAGRAADAIQGAMTVAVWTAPASDRRGADDVKTWLCRLLVDECIDRMRQAAPDATGPDAMAAMRHLAVEQQSALVLVDMLGFPVAEASNVLGISAGTLLRRCARGRARLLAALTLVQQSPQRPDATSTGPPAGST